MSFNQTMKTYNLCQRRYKWLLNNLNLKVFRRPPDPMKKPGPLKIYIEEEIFLYKCRRFGALLNKSKEVRK